MIGDDNDEGSGTSSGTPDGGIVIIGGARSIEHPDRRAFLLVLLVLDRTGELDLLLERRWR